MSDAPDDRGFEHDPVMRDEIVDTFAAVPAGYVLDGWIKVRTAFF